MNVHHAKDTLTEACDMACEELDYWIGRICRQPPVLQLARVGTRYTVVNVSDSPSAMLPLTSLATCVRFAEAVCRKHPEAVMDESFGTFATQNSGERESSGRTGGSPEHLTPEQAHALAVNRLCELLADPHSRRVPDNVIPLRKELA